MIELWESLRGAWGSDLQLRNGAKKADIKAVEKTLRLALPESMKQSLAFHDGQEATATITWIPDVAPGMRLLSLKEILPLWRSVFQDDDIQPTRRAVLDAPFHPKHVPFAESEYTSSYLCIDFIPGPRGVDGQIIHNVNECDFVVVASSFEDWLKRVAKKTAMGSKKKASSAAFQRLAVRLSDAASKGAIDEIRAALSDGADVNGGPPAGHDPPLHAAAYHGHLKAVSLLLKAGARLDALCSGYEQTALDVALGAGHVPVACALLDAGVPFTKKGRTVLHWAAAGGHPAAIAFAHQQLGDANPKDAEGTTPLLDAAMQGGLPAVQTLLKLGADPRSVNKAGESALSRAVVASRVDVVQALMALGIRPSTDQLCRYAASNGSPEMARMLLRAGVDLEYRGERRRPALLEATIRKNQNLVELLLESGARCDVVDEAGMSAFDYARQSKSNALVRLIERYGGGPAPATKRVDDTYVRALTNALEAIAETNIASSGSTTKRALALPIVREDFNRFAAALVERQQVAQMFGPFCKRAIVELGRAFGAPGGPAPWTVPWGPGYRTICEDSSWDFNEDFRRGDRGLESACGRDTETGPASETGRVNVTEE